MNRVCDIAILTAVAALTACSSNRYCEGPQPYESARSIPPLVGTENLKIPSSTTALKVPPAKGESLSFGYVVQDPSKPGKTRIECLDQPPPIPPLAEAAN